jgi:hypothetical protein
MVQSSQQGHGQQLPRPPLLAAYATLGTATSASNRARVFQVFQGFIFGSSAARRAR